MEFFSQEARSSYAAQNSMPEANPHSEFWENAPALIMTNDAYGRKVSGHWTEIRSRWTKNNLYFLFLCHYEELHLKPEPDVTAKTDALWNWDVAEVFIGSNADPVHRYKEFEVSPQGEWLDWDVNLEKADKVNDHSWRSGIQVAVRIAREKKIWYGCMQIPFPCIEKVQPAAGNTLRINFFRSQGPKHVELAWRPSLQPSFHVPERFGTLRLVP